MFIICRADLVNDILLKSSPTYPTVENSEFSSEKRYWYLLYWGTHYGIVLCHLQPIRRPGEPYVHRTPKSAATSVFFGMSLSVLLIFRAMGQVHRQIDMLIFVIESVFFKEIDGGFVVGVGIDQNHAGAEFDEFVAHGSEQGGADAASFQIGIDAEPYAITVSPRGVFFFDDIAQGKSDDFFVARGHKTGIGIGSIKRHHFEFVPRAIECRPFIGRKQSLAEVKNGGQIADFHGTDIELFRIRVVERMRRHLFFAVGFGVFQARRCIFIIERFERLE